MYINDRNDHLSVPIYQIILHQFINLLDLQQTKTPPESIKYTNLRQTKISNQYINFPNLQPTEMSP